MRQRLLVLKRVEALRSAEERAAEAAVALAQARVRKLEHQLHANAEGQSTAICVLSESLADSDRGRQIQAQAALQVLQKSRLWVINGIVDAKRELSRAAALLGQARRRKETVQTARENLAVEVFRLEERRLQSSLDDQFAQKAMTGRGKISDL